MERTGFLRGLIGSNTCFCLIRSLLVASLSVSYNSGYLMAQLEQCEGLLPAVEDSDLGRSISLSSNGLRLAIGATYQNNTTPQPGRVFIYERSSNQWNLLAELVGEQDEDKFGMAVALSGGGDKLLVGAPGHDGDKEDSGRAYVYDEAINGWAQPRVFDGEEEDDQWGTSVDISVDGNMIVIGIPGFKGANGKAKVFSYHGTWEPRGSDLIYDDGAGVIDRMGTSVSVSGDAGMVAVSSPGAGLVRIYEWNITSSDWVLLDNKFGINSFTQFGRSISLSSDGHRIAIGETSYSSSRGRAMVYELTGNRYAQLGNSFIGERAGDQLGEVALSEDGRVVAVGAPFYEPDGGPGTSWGQVRVYHWNGVSWVLDLEEVGDAAGDAIGISLALNDDGNALAIGSPFNSSTSGCSQIEVQSMNGVPLPVELTEFEGSSENGRVVLTWRTSSEKNNEGFWVERSSDGLDWIPVAFVEGSGTTPEIQYYEFQESQLPLGTYYYRLKQIDFDGQYEYFGPIYLELTPPASVNLYPNPAGNRINFIGAKHVSLYDLAGHLRLSVPVDRQDAVETARLPDGLYMVVITTRSGSVQRKKVMIRR